MGKCSWCRVIYRANTLHSRYRVWGRHCVCLKPEKGFKVHRGLFMGVQCELDTWQVQLQQEVNIDKYEWMIFVMQSLALHILVPKQQHPPELGINDVWEEATKATWMVFHSAAREWQRKVRQLELTLPPRLICSYRKPTKVPKEREREAGRDHQEGLAAFNYCSCPQKRFGAPGIFYFNNCLVDWFSFAVSLVSSSGQGQLHR